MKNNRFIIAGVLAVLLTFALVLAGCGDGAGGGGGTLKIVNNNASAITHVRIATASLPMSIYTDPTIVVNEAVTIAPNNGTKSYSISLGGHKTVFCLVTVTFNGTPLSGEISFEQGETGILTLDASGSLSSYDPY
jgi:hypothetical protein